MATSTSLDQLSSESEAEHKNNIPQTENKNAESSDEDVDCFKGKGAIGQPLYSLSNMEPKVQQQDWEDVMQSEKTLRLLKTDIQPEQHKKEGNMKQFQQPFQHLERRIVEQLQQEKDGVNGKLLENKAPLIVPNLEFEVGPFTPPRTLSGIIKGKDEIGWPVGFQSNVEPKWQQLDGEDAEQKSETEYTNNVAWTNKKVVLESSDEDLARRKGRDEKAWLLNSPLDMDPKLQQWDGENVQQNERNRKLMKTEPRPQQQKKKGNMKLEKIEQMLLEREQLQLQMKRALLVLEAQLQQEKDERKKEREEMNRMLLLVEAQLQQDKVERKKEREEMNRMLFLFEAQLQQDKDERKKEREEMNRMLLLVEAQSQEEKKEMERTQKNQLQTIQQLQLQLYRTERQIDHHRVTTERIMEEAQENHERQHVELEHRHQQQMNDIFQHWVEIVLIRSQVERMNNPAANDDVQAVVDAPLPAPAQNVIDNLPRVIDGDWVCLVCRDKQLGDIRELPACAHKYHFHCIRQWLRLHNNCPLCREQVY